jgi:hypothetical protein
LWQICISPLGCRNADLHLLRMQEWYGSPGGWNTHSSVLGLQIQHFQVLGLAVCTTIPCLLVCWFVCFFLMCPAC